ncbi:tetratricopeptide repeat protein [uncultured Corynebacterium sp.]
MMEHRGGQYSRGENGDSRENGGNSGRPSGGRSGAGRGSAGRGGTGRGGGPRGNSRGGSRGGARGSHGGPGQRRGHGQRGGAGRDEGKGRLNPQRSGFREERLNKRQSEPDLPDDIDVRDLDPLVLQDLKVLSKVNADAVAKHMIMAATLMEDDPQLALRHARAAKDRAGRVSVARETNGIAAYRAGEWKEALSELRAARRMSGGPGLLAIMADCERALGRPLKAVELSRSPEAAELDPASAVELAIVAAGARRDLGQDEAAVVTLERLGPSLESSGYVAARLSYAYADALLAVGRVAEARRWFEHCRENDRDELLDAAARLEELDQ